MSMETFLKIREMGKEIKRKRQNEVQMQISNHNAQIGSGRRNKLYY